LKQLTQLQQLPIQLSSSRQSTPQSTLLQQQGLKELQVYDKKDACRHDHFKKKSDEAMHNDQSSLSSAGNLSGRRSLDVLGLGLAQAAGATTTIMLTKVITSLAQPPRAGICTPRTTMMNIIIVQTKAVLSLPPYPLQRRTRSAPRNREYELALQVRAYPQILSKYLSVCLSVACVPLQIILGTVFRLISCSVVCETA
jgi:hypothetical protein